MPNIFAYDTQGLLRRGKYLYAYDAAGNLQRITSAYAYDAGGVRRKIFPNLDTYSVGVAQGNNVALAPYVGYRRILVPTGVAQSTNQAYTLSRSTSFIIFTAAQLLNSEPKSYGVGTYDPDWARFTVDVGNQPTFQGSSPFPNGRFGMFVDNSHHTDLMVFPGWLTLQMKCLPGNPLKTAFTTMQIKENGTIKYTLNSVDAAYSWIEADKDAIWTWGTFAALTIGNVYEVKLI